MASDSRQRIAAAKARAKENEKRDQEARKAAKAARKDTTDPAQMGRMRQIREAYRITHEYDRPLPWLLLGSFLVPLAVLVVLGFVFDSVWFMIPLGILLGILGAMLMLVQRTKKATYKRYAGQAGSAEVGLSMLSKKYVKTPVITATKQSDVVHRVVGPCGIVLIGEGEPGRLKAVLASEQRKHENISYNVPVTMVMMGDRAGQVPLPKLADHIRKMPKVLQAHQVTEVTNRLRALDAVRPKLPIPKGFVPSSMRGARQGLRGR